MADLEPVLLPTVDPSPIVGTTPILDTTKKSILDGVFTVDASLSSGNRFGKKVSLRLAADGEVDLYAENGVTFFALSGGVRNDSAIFTGIWRSVQGASTGTAIFYILPDEGGRELASGGKPKNELVLRGTYGDGNGRRNHALVLRRTAKLNDDLKDFQIIAHRGGGRNSERLGYSENSVELIRRATRLGATSIEIDVRATSDGVPIVFHDNTFTPRTVTGAYLIGDIRNYSLAQMKQFAHLLYGEKIPTLKEALDEIVYNTDLSMVWLDVKDAAATDKIIELQQQAIADAAANGRTIRFLFGIPDTDVLDAYRGSKHRGSVDVLCELDPDIVLEIGAVVWATRFTGGVQESTAQWMRDEGKDVYVWTLDDPAFIDTFLEPRYKGKPLYSGILTNYPTLLAARFYSNKVKL